MIISFAKNIGEKILIDIIEEIIKRIKENKALLKKCFNFRQKTSSN